MKTAIDITPQQHFEILNLLEKYIPRVSVWAYGSRIKGTSNPQSDLDLIAFTTKDQQAQVSALRGAFEESNLPFRVDLFVWDEVPEQFHQIIKKEHLVFSKEMLNLENR